MHPLYPQSRRIYLLYKKAQAQLDEISPVISNYAIKYEKILLKAKYRKDLEKKYGEYDR